VITATAASEEKTIDGNHLLNLFDEAMKWKAVDGHAGGHEFCE
jgi:hypothetical protein